MDFGKGGYFFCGLFVLFMSCVCVMLLRLPCGLLTSWLSFVMFNCVFVTFPCGILSLVKCGTWLYRFLTFANFLTFICIKGWGSLY